MTGTDRLPVPEDESAKVDLSPSPTEKPYPFLHLNGEIENFLTEHGLDPKKPYTKSELRALGYAMYNRVGDGTVAIIKQIGDRDTRMDTLLTIQQIEQHRRESLPEGINVSELPMIEADMKKFMREVSVVTMVSQLLDPESRFGGTWMQNYCMNFLHDLNDKYPDWRVLDKAEAAGVIDWAGREDLIRETAAEVKARYDVPDTIRAIPLERLDRRGEGNGNFGYPCPCMDCNQTFEASDGIKIYDDGSVTGTPGQVRMNYIVSHLAGHGINSNQNQTVNHDHRYMTLRGYMPIYAKREMDAAIDLDALDYEKIDLELVMGNYHRLIDLIGLSHLVSDEFLLKKAKKALFIKD